MYAVIESGGKQYRVELGTELAVDRLDVQPGQAIDFERVLLVADDEKAAVGRPTVEGARVSADVVRQARGDKIVVFKYRPKARSRVKQGHRAELTVLRISDIVLGSKSARKLAQDAQTERQRVEAAAAEIAAKQAAADRALAAKLAREAEAAEEAAAATEGKATKGAKAKVPSRATAKAPTRALEKSGTETAPGKKTGTQAKAETKAEAGSGAEATKATKAPQSAASRTQAPPPAVKAKAPRNTRKDR